MLFLICSALAGENVPQASSLLSFLPVVLIGLSFYFFLIKPQQKRVKQQQALLSALKKGDKVITQSGIVGSVAKIVDDQEIVLEVADNVFVRFLKTSVSTIVAPLATDSSHSSHPVSAVLVQKEPGTSVKRKNLEKKAIGVEVISDAKKPIQMVESGNSGVGE